VPREPPKLASMPVPLNWDDIVSLVMPEDGKFVVIHGIMEQPPQASAGRGAGDDFSFCRAHSVSPQSPTLILMTHPHEPVR